MYIYWLYIYIYMFIYMMIIYIRMPSNCLNISFNRMSAVVALSSGESFEFGKRTCPTLRRWHRCTSTLLVLQRDLVWQLSCVSDLFSITWIPFHKFLPKWCLMQQEWFPTTTSTSFFRGSDEAAAPHHARATTQTWDVEWTERSPPGRTLDARRCWRDLPLR